MSFASFSRGRPVSALLLTVGAVLAGGYVATTPAPVETKPARLILEVQHQQQPSPAQYPFVPVR